MKEFFEQLLGGVARCPTGPSKNSCEGAIVKLEFLKRSLVSRSEDYRLF
jgi:hypothetical protein